MPSHDGLNIATVALAFTLVDAGITARNVVSSSERPDISIEGGTLECALGFLEEALLNPSTTLGR